MKIFIHTMVLMFAAMTLCLSTGFAETSAASDATAIVNGSSYSGVTASSNSGGNTLLGGNTEINLGGTTVDVGGTALEVGGQSRNDICPSNYSGSL